ncbi:MAG: tetratricopeptide repeat protein [Bacteroidetes bacterium]|nr:tetratricopeptide repeat protein [Bacteroidota bacterium]
MNSSGKTLIKALIVTSLAGACTNPKADDKAPLTTKPAMLRDSVQKYLDAKIVEDTTVADSYFQRARYYIANRKYTLAHNDMVKAIEIDSANAQYYHLIGDLFMFEKEAFKARISYQKALDLKPESTEILFKLAQLLFYGQDYKPALDYVATIERLKPGDVNAMFLRGLIYKDKKDFANAKRAFLRCTEIKKDHYDSFIQLGILHGENKEKIALSYYDAALRIKANSEEAVYGKAMLYQNTNYLDEAIKEYSTLMKINPGNKNAYFNTGYIHLVKLREYNEAIDYFGRAINCDSMYFEAYYNRGYSYEMRGDIGAARKDYLKAIDINPAYKMPREGLKRVGK